MRVRWHVEVRLSVREGSYLEDHEISICAPNVVIYRSFRSVDSHILIAQLYGAFVLIETKRDPKLQARVGHALLLLELTIARIVI